MNHLKCKFCRDERKNANSLRNHERLCKSNPERQSTPFQSTDFQKSKKRSNNYIKGIEMGRPYQISNETRQKLSDANKARGSEWHKENGKRISKTINEKVANGEWHTSLAKNMHYNYNGCDLHGKWELTYAKYLDEKNIKWERPKNRFKYIFKGKSRHYTPDFYLIEEDVYVEIKGYKTDKDEAKWSQFVYNTPLRVLMKDDLKQLNII